MIPQGHQRGDATHERKDVDVINLVMIALLLFLMIGVCLLVSGVTLHVLKRGQPVQETPRKEMATQVAKFPQPRLIVDPGSEEKRAQLKAQIELETYGWADRQAGVARIPIKRAMQLLIERGLPEVGAGQTRLKLMQARPQSNLQPNESITSPTPKASP